MTTPRITAPALYAHAIAIEREAIARYSEFAERMADLGNHAVAEVFATLARLETEHLEALAARELVFRLMTPRHALEIALAGEKRAAAFFEQVVVSVEDAMLRALAAEMAADEADHVALLEKLLETTPGPIVDWASVYDMETTHGHRL